jgi:hypothetical protein
MATTEALLKDVKVGTNVGAGSTWQRMVFIRVLGLMNGLNFAAVFFANVVGQKHRRNHIVGQKTVSF